MGTNAVLATSSDEVGKFLLQSEPILAGVQEVCARIGVVTGKGIATVVRGHFSKPVLYIVVLLVLIANTINSETIRCKKRV
jgi:Mn2+/Fe2+ NRAMP family transporter